ncbi:hypothetical protein K8R33_03725 [archaeon]|nr:hypothetical protein [archaeon]
MGEEQEVLYHGSEIGEAMGFVKETSGTTWLRQFNRVTDSLLSVNEVKYFNGVPISAGLSYVTRSEIEGMVQVLDSQRD